MSLSIELLKAMDDGHAINALRASFDPLVNTPLEAFLIDWIESLVDPRDDELTDAISQVEFSAKDIVALGEALIQSTETTVAILQAVAEAGFDDAEVLKADLKLASDFRALANDGAEFITRLNALVSTNQE